MSDDAKDPTWPITDHHHYIHGQPCYEHGNFLLKAFIRRYERPTSMHQQHITWRDMVANIQHIIQCPNPDSDVSAWMEGEYNVQFQDLCLVTQNMLLNPDFNGEIDYSIMHQFECEAPHEHFRYYWLPMVSGVYKNVPLVAKDIF
ncbi:hypothetical protein BKA93DRAFT_753015 [Sparassis latifolia]